MTPESDHAATSERTDASTVWDERYADADLVWSGDPNGALVAEVESLAPGTVLDVGCGEGADAVWLAQRGWQVTALDVSGVALERGRQAAADAGVEVTWLHTGLVEADMPDGGFDLVSAQYPAIERSTGHDAERALMAAVAPGGTLLFVHHSTFGSQPAGAEHYEGRAHEHDHDHHGEGHGDRRGVDPTAYVGPVDMVGALNSADWHIETHEVRDREVRGGAGAHHHEDVVVKAHRPV